MDLKLGYTQEIIKAAKERGVLRNQLAYILATAYHETAHTMKPVKEAYWVKDAENWRKKNLRYYPWYGRGYVQLTWEYNYKKAGDKLGVDLVGNKELALDPKIAANILVLGMIEGWFTTRKLSDYITLQKSDFVGARKIINGSDKATEIAEIAKKYDADLKAIGYGEVPNRVPLVSEASIAPVALSDEQTVTVIRIIASIIRLIIGIFKK